MLLPRLKAKSTVPVPLGLGALSVRVPLPPDRLMLPVGAVLQAVVVAPVAST